LVFRCDIAGSDLERRLEIPAWMFDRSACAKVRLTADPRADLSSLVALGSLLRDVLHDRPAESNVSVSTVSSLSHDPNRGDAHATPGQAEAGAPPRAASNRFVRRRTTDDRADADLVALPMETQAVLTGLVTQLILDHADRIRVGLLTGDGDDR
jgi:hypothetical protein